MKATVQVANNIQACHSPLSQRPGSMHRLLLGHPHAQDYCHNDTVTLIAHQAAQLHVLAQRD